MIREHQAWGIVGRLHDGKDVPGILHPSPCVVLAYEAIDFIGDISHGYRREQDTTCIWIGLELGNV